MQGVDHYENFPVASWLCPPQWRPPIAAIYHFARTADDLADEGEAPASERLQDLARYRTDLRQAFETTPVASARWPHVFGPLAVAIATHQLPPQPLFDLLDAFEQDVRYTDAQTPYTHESELLDYCQRSANPVGRLLLHLYGVTDEHSLQQSDAICTALQLINFWQDLSQDLQRRRHYLPTEVLRKHRLTLADLRQPEPSAATIEAARGMVRELCDSARKRMMMGATLAVRLPGRVGWESRLVVQGGLRVLDHIENLQHRTWQMRPQLGARDLPLLIWRAFRMKNT